MRVGPVHPPRSGRCDLTPAFWEGVRGSRRRLLMLDYDGTLTSFRVERDQAQLAPRTRAALWGIAGAGTTRLAVISGRQLFELERLTGGLPLHLVGEHGWEERTPEGVRSRWRPSPESARRLEQAARVALASGWGRHLERRRCSVVLHTRGMEPEAARELELGCERMWRSFFERDGVRLHRIEGGLMLRAFARHKGTAVRGLVAGAPPGTLAVYLGDDVSDEDAFLGLPEGGVAVHVGGGWGPSAARFHLASTEDVAGFLERWGTEAGRARSGARCG